ncbi:MAG: hypothetical protein R3B53_02970 [Candidatus Paceibacterota bacterium]
MLSIIKNIAIYKVMFYVSWLCFLIIFGLNIYLLSINDVNLGEVYFDFDIFVVFYTLPLNIVALVLSLIYTKKRNHTYESSGSYNKLFWWLSFFILPIILLYYFFIISANYIDNRIDSHNRWEQFFKERDSGKFNKEF